MGAKCSSRPTLSSNAATVPTHRRRGHPQALGNDLGQGRACAHVTQQTESSQIPTGKNILEIPPLGGGWLGWLFFKHIPPYSLDHLGSAFTCLLPLSVTCTQLGFFLGGTYYA